MVRTDSEFNSEVWRRGNARKAARRRRRRITAAATPVMCLILCAAVIQLYPALRYRCQRLILHSMQEEMDAITSETSVENAPQQAPSTAGMWVGDCVSSPTAAEQKTPSAYCTGTIVALSGDSVTVSPAAGSPEAASGDRIVFSREGLEPLEVSVGDAVVIGYDGHIMETYPCRIHALTWEKADPAGREPR